MTDTPPLRTAVRLGTGGWFPLIALSALVVVDQFQGQAFLVLGPEVSDALGLSRSSLSALASIKTLAIMVASLPIAAFVQARPRRALVAKTTAVVWSFAAIGTGFVVGVPALAVLILINGLATGSVVAVHVPLLADSYPAGARVRILAAYQAANTLGNVVAPLVVAAVVGLGFTWRAVFVAMGSLSLAGALLGLGLREPAVASAPAAAVDAAALRFGEVVRRLLHIPTMRAVLTASAVLGMMLVPLYTYLFFFLDDRWGMGAAERGLFFATTPIVTVPVLAWFGRRGERSFGEDPGSVARAGARFLAAGVVLLAVAMFVPWFAAMAALTCGAFACLAVVGPVVNSLLVAVVPAPMRPHAAALNGIFLSAVGGLGGLLLLGGIDRRFGVAGAIASLLVPGGLAAVVLWRSAVGVAGDVGRLEQENAVALAAAERRGRGEREPALAICDLSFAYGTIPILHGVDLTVDEGEMVALLGVNGAGKSTLLRVVSGLALPQAGSIHSFGRDVTWLDAERRVELGITQVPGGRATFAGLSVIDNLRVHGYSLGRTHRAVDAAIDECLDVFPRLAAARNRPAEVLSGGERQMLALSKALLLRPRLLCIDELSLGLSPKVVGELLTIVRRINGEGTAVILVEQSVNVALSTASHAYFMERGAIRFDGRAADLIGRDDLLRSVFLEGAPAPLPTQGQP